MARPLPYQDTIRALLALPSNLEIVATTPATDDNGAPVYRVRIASGNAWCEVDVSAMLVREVADLRSVAIDAAAGAATEALARFLEQPHPALRRFLP